VRGAARGPLADRVAALLDRTREPLGQAAAILERVRAQGDRVFDPEAVEALASLAEREHAWLDFASPRLGCELYKRFGRADLAAMVGFGTREQILVQAAGLLHDLGKLAVPGQVLEFPGRLDDAQRNLMRAHTHHTWRALRPIEDFAALAPWAACHHERLDGSGYPFHQRGADLPGAPARAGRDAGDRQDRGVRGLPAAGGGEPDGMGIGSIRE